MGRKKNSSKESTAEDWCFVCKDGGTLQICDNKNCLKAYHLDCVSKLDSSLMRTGKKWTCDLHYCSKCHKPSKFYCLCCPSAICGTCIYQAEFAIVKRDKGLCDECLELTLIIEGKKDVDSNGRKIDFSDKDTEEFFFYDYWRIIKEKEQLTSKEVILASNMLKSGENYKLAYDSDDLDKSEGVMSRKRKRPNRKKSASKSLANEDSDSVGHKRQRHSCSVKKFHCKGDVVDEPLNIEDSESAGNEATGPKEQEHNLGTEESTPRKTTEDECQFQSLMDDGLADIGENSSFLHWSEKTERSNGAKSVKNVNGAEWTAKDQVIEQNRSNLLFLSTISKNLDCLQPVHVESEQELQSLLEDPLPADKQFVVSASLVYSRRNRQESSDGLPESSIGRAVNGSFCQMPSDQLELFNELPAGTVAAHVEPVLKESSVEWTFNKNGVSCIMQSERRLLSNEDQVVDPVALALQVEPANEDSLRADEHDIVTTSEGHVNDLVDVSVTAATPSSRPATAVLQSELLEASIPSLQSAEMIDVKVEKETEESNDFFEDLPGLFDQSLEELSRSSAKDLVIPTVSPGKIVEAKCCLYQFSLMNFEKIKDHAEKNQFLSSMDMLLKHGYIPKHMFDKVSDLRLKFSSNTQLYSECQASVRMADKERELAVSSKQELEEVHRACIEIEREKRVVGGKIEELRDQLRYLDEKRKSLKASSKASKIALYEYIQGYKTQKKSKEAAQEAMKNIHESWSSFQTEVLKLLTDFSA